MWKYLTTPRFSWIGLVIISIMSSALNTWVTPLLFK